MSSTTTLTSTGESIVDQRKAALGRLFYVSAFHAWLGGIALILGITFTALAINNGGFPFNTGYGIWCNINLCVAGIFGVLASRCDVSYEQIPPRKFRVFMGCYYGFSISGLSFAGLSFGYSIGAAVQLSDDRGYTSRFEYDDQLYVISIIIAIVSLALWFLCLYGCIFFWRNRKLFNFRSWREIQLHQQVKTLEGKVEGLQQQLDGQSNYGTTGSINKEKEGYH